MIQQREKDWNLKEEKDVGKRGQERENTQEEEHTNIAENIAKNIAEKNEVILFSTHPDGVYLYPSSHTSPLFHFATLLWQPSMMADFERGGRKVHVLSRIRMQVARKMVMRGWRKKRGVSEKERQKHIPISSSNERDAPIALKRTKKTKETTLLRDDREDTHSWRRSHTTMMEAQRGERRNHCHSSPSDFNRFLRPKVGGEGERCLSFTCLSLTSPKSIYWPIGKGETFKTTPLSRETTDLCSKGENHSHSTNTSSLLLSTTSSQVIKRLTFERS